jgi:WD40 repeat protein
MLHSRTFPVHTDRVHSVTILGDSQHSASGSDDKTIIILDTSAGQVKHTLTGHHARVVCVDVSKDDTMLVSGDYDGTIIFWRLHKDGAAPTVLRTFKGHAKCVWAVAFSPDGQKIASCSGDGAVMVWSAQSGERLQRFTGHGGAVCCLAWSPDSKHVACAGQGGIIRVIEAATGTQVRELKGGHKAGSSVFCLVYRATSDVLYSGGGCGDCAIIEWRLAEGREATVTRRLRGHTGTVSGMAMSPCNEFIASASCDRTVRIWGLATGGGLRAIQSGSLLWRGRVTGKPL